MIILTTHAKERLAERLTKRKDKWQRIAQKALVSKEGGKPLYRVSKRKVPDGFRGEPVFRSFLGLVFIFSRRPDKVILVTVVSPGEVPIYGTN